MSDVFKLILSACALQAALEFLLVTGRQPDILHCHDWSTAGVAQVQQHRLCLIP